MWHSTSRMQCPQRATVCLSGWSCHCPCLVPAHHWVGVREGLLQHLQEALVLHQLSIDVKQLGHTHTCCLAHIRILILYVCVCVCVCVCACVQNTSNFSGGWSSPPPLPRPLTLKHLRRGSHRYSVILSTRMHPMVLTARARIRGLESSQSCRRRAGEGAGLTDSGTATTLVFS